MNFLKVHQKIIQKHKVHHKKQIQVSNKKLISQNIEVNYKRDAIQFHLIKINPIIHRFIILNSNV